MNELICLASALALTTIFFVLTKGVYKMLQTMQEMTCPQCGRRFATDIIEKKPLGIFKKFKVDLIAGIDDSRGEPYGPFRMNSNRYMKFRYTNRCRQCGHEWFSTSSERA